MAAVFSAADEVATLSLIKQASRACCVSTWPSLDVFVFVFVFACVCVRACVYDVCVFVANLASHNRWTDWMAFDVGLTGKMRTTRCPVGCVILHVLACFVCRYFYEVVRSVSGWLG